MYDDYGDRGFVPVTINLWQDMSIVKAYASQYTYPYWRDGNGSVWNLYNINNSIPVNYVLDTTMTVLYGSTGFSETTLRYYIENALPQVGVEEGQLPVARIESVRPSPARGPVTVRLALPQAGRVSVRVFSSAGRLVRELHSGEVAAGQRDFSWNLTGRDGARVPAGTYFVELNAAGQSSRTKLSVLD